MEKRKAEFDRIDGFELQEEVYDSDKELLEAGKIPSGVKNNVNSDLIEEILGIEDRLSRLVLDSVNTNIVKKPTSELKNMRDMSSLVESYLTGSSTKRTLFTEDDEQDIHVDFALDEIENIENDLILENTEDIQLSNEAVDSREEGELFSDLAPPIDYINDDGIDEALSSSEQVDCIYDVGIDSIISSHSTNSENVNNDVQFNGNVNNYLDVPQKSLYPEDNVSDVTSTSYLSDENSLSDGSEGTISCELDKILMHIKINEGL